MPIEDMDTPEEVEAQKRLDEEIRAKENKEREYETWRKMNPDTKTEAGLIVEALNQLVIVMKEGNIYENMWKDVKEFHRAMDLKYVGKPRMLPSKMKGECVRYMWEELEEYTEADTEEEAFDALIDLIYFALGAAYFHGFPFPIGWERVHEANMKKNQARWGDKQGVIKPDNWKHPDLSDLVE